MRKRPIKNAGDTFPAIRSNKELENTIKAMHAGSIKTNVASA